MHPTHEAYAELQAAFDHFNRTLFGGMLEQPLFTLQRERRTYGYCSRQRFVSRSSGTLVDEIAMNPAYFAVRSIRETLSTLVHEMVHQWQFHHGNPGRRGYHNTEWANKMEAVGLMPSNTGRPGGQRTGEQMTHYVIDGGPFDMQCEALLTDAFTLSWLDRFPAERPAQPLRPLRIDGAPLPSLGDDDDDDRDDGAGMDEGREPMELPSGIVLPPLEPVNKSNRVKYYCDECKAQAWGKPGLRLLCGGQQVRRGEETTDVTHSPVGMRPIQIGQG